MQAERRRHGRAVAAVLARRRQVRRCHRDQRAQRRRARAEPTAREQGGQGQADVGRQGHGAGDVGPLRRPAIAEDGAHLDAGAVATLAAEAQSEGGGERGLGDPAVGRRVVGRVVTHRSHDRCGRGRAHADDERRGQARRHPVGEVVEPGAGPAVLAVAGRAVADHGVEGVDRPVAQRAGSTGQRGPAGRRDHGVDRVLGHRLDHRPHDVGLVQRPRVTPHQALHGEARAVEVARGRARRRPARPRRPDRVRPRPGTWPRWWPRPLDRGRPRRRRRARGRRRRGRSPPARVPS